MKIIMRFCFILLTIFIGGCSFAPGIPGLKTDLTGKIKPQQEGVDYKVVIIDANYVGNQKPFDFANYVRNKKLLASQYSSKLKSSGDFSPTINKAGQLNGAAKINGSIRANSYQSPLRSKVVSQFEGVTANDLKANYQYFIGKGDALNITVWDHPELTRPSENNTYGGYVIGSDGRFYFPYTGKINALGKTIGTIRDELERKLSAFITKPQVSISIVEYRSQKIYTSGALVKPSTLAIDDTPTTVRDAISKSGGLIPFQYTGYATLARKGKNISIDLNRMLKHNDNRQNFILKDGDRLNVVERGELDEFNRKLGLDVTKENTLSEVKLRNEIKNIATLNPIRLKLELEKQRLQAELKKEIERELRSEQAKVFVMGEIRQPGSVKYQIIDGMTLAEAISDAGSFKEETVNPKGIFVIRKEATTDKIPTVYQLPIIAVHSLFLAEQFNLRPRDIVYITAMPSIRWNRIIAQLIPSLTLFNATR